MNIANKLSHIPPRVLNEAYATWGLDEFFNTTLEPTPASAEAFRELRAAKAAGDLIVREVVNGVTHVSIVDAALKTRRVLPVEIQFRKDFL